MAEEEKLKLGKGAAFVKSRLKRLSQRDETWEADFLALSKPIEQTQTHYLGMVVSSRDGSLLAETTVHGRPSVNDLATILAHAMRRPLDGDARRPRLVHLRGHHQWRELLALRGIVWGILTAWRTLRCPPWRQTAMLVRGPATPFTSRGQRLRRERTCCCCLISSSSNNKTLVLPGGASSWQVCNGVRRAILPEKQGFSGFSDHYVTHTIPRRTELFSHLEEIGIGVKVFAGQELPGIEEAYKEHVRLVQEARRVGMIQPTPEQARIDTLFPAIDKWVKEYGWIEIGVQELFGFVARALHEGGVQVEDDRPDTLAEALAALEVGLTRWFEKEGVDLD